MKKNASLSIGVLAGISSGMLFGSDFLPAQILSSFTSLEFYFIRAFFFGAAGFLFIRPAFRAFRAFTMRDKLLAVALNAAGFWLYSLLLFWSIKHGNAVVSTIVVGAMPATIALASKKISDLGAPFIAGIALILAGLLTLNIASFSVISGAGFVVWILPFVCLLLWTWYAVANAGFVKRHPELSKTDMVSIMGVLSFVIMISVGACTLDIPHLVHHEQFATYALWGFISGVGSSWLGFWLWNICSKHCPPSVSGPLLVSETMFGLLYTFIYQHRLPEPNEAAAILLFGIGAVLVIRAETRAVDAIPL